MKYFKKIAAVALIGVMLVSLAGCGKTVKKIDEDKIIEVAKKQLDLKKKDFRDGEDDEMWGTNFEDVDNPYIYEDVYYLKASEYDDDESMWISYYIFEDEEDANDYFSHYYEAYSFLDKKDRNYKEGKNGYYIDANDDDSFSAVYYAEDMVIDVSAYGKESAKKMKKYVGKLGLPN
ncbi:MAG: hypothetical protein K6G47_02710 [Clostridia bacterium]|nr:hypothetical protein [Clostridia bacterium]